MENKKLLNILMIVSFAATLSACAPERKSQEQKHSSGFVQSASQSMSPQAPKEVTLISRYTGGTYETATYSFKHLSQDVELTRNNWEILFEAPEDLKDYFQVNMVVDDNSFIYDLGKRSCLDIQSEYPGDRKKRPLVWLAYSDADPSDLEPMQTVQVQEGHCYLTYNNDEDGRVVALFHVKSHVKSKTVTIDEIEVLNVLNADRK